MRKIWTFRALTFHKTSFWVKTQNENFPKEMILLNLPATSCQKFRKLIFDKTWKSLFRTHFSLKTTTQDSLPKIIWVNLILNVAATSCENSEKVRHQFLIKLEKLLFGPILKYFGSKITIREIFKKNPAPSHFMLNHNFFANNSGFHGTCTLWVQ